MERHPRFHSVLVIWLIFSGDVWLCSKFVNPIKNQKNFGWVSNNVVPDLIIQMFHCFWAAQQLMNVQVCFRVLKAPEFQKEGYTKMRFYILFFFENVIRSPHSKKLSTQHCLANAWTTDNENILVSSVNNMCYWYTLRPIGIGFWVNCKLFLSLCRKVIFSPAFMNLQIDINSIDI